MNFKFLNCFLIFTSIVLEKCIVLSATIKNQNLKQKNDAALKKPHNEKIKLYAL